MKYRVKDGDETYEIEEIEEEPKKPDMADDDTSSLSEDEITALKKLAAVADKLVDLTATAHAGTTTATDDEDEDVDVDVDKDDDEDVVIDTRRRHDSKRSFGSLEKRRKKPTADSVEVDEVADAWAKRYGGNK